MGDSIQSKNANYSLQLNNNILKCGLQPKLENANFIWFEKTSKLVYKNYQ